MLKDQGQKWRKYIGYNDTTQAAIEKYTCQHEAAATARYFFPKARKAVWREHPQVNEHCQV